jgi:hypothetical protein
MNIDMIETSAVIFGSVATGVGVIVAVVVGIIQARSASKNLERSRHSLQMQALLAFDELLEHYHHIHSGVRPGGNLIRKKELEHQEVVDIERYLGLFERAKVFIYDGYVSIEHFRTMYGYRMLNIARQPWVRKHKLQEEADGWKYFLELYKKLYPDDYDKIVGGVMIPDN